MPWCRFSVAAFRRECRLVVSKDEENRRVGKGALAPCPPSIHDRDLNGGHASALPTLPTEIAERSFGFDTCTARTAQPPEKTVAGKNPHLRRDRNHSQRPDRADHGAIARLDHRRSRARPDRPWVRARDDRGDLRHAVRADG